MGIKNIIRNLKFNKQIYSFLNTTKGYIVCGALMGILMFLLLYGTAPLYTKNVLWIYNNGGDLFQHQIGWEFFRNAPWKFLFGTYDTYPYPYTNSIIYTDSIPLFAIFFKLFRAWLPINFQYFGIWGILCFILQGVFATLILRKFKIKLPFILVVLPLFLCSSIALWRFYRHTSLGGHWIILATILVWLYKDTLTLKRKIVFYSIIGIIACSIHMYFIVMIFCIILSDAVNNYLTSKNIRNCLKILLYPMCFTLLWMYFIGAFVVKSPVSGGLGSYSMNVNALFNSSIGISYSPYLNNLPMNSMQYEGNNYLGFGIIILLIMAISYGSFNIKSLIKNKKSLITVSIIVIPLTLLAFSPHITLGEITILNLLPILSEDIKDILSIFRSSGRLFWPVWYLIVIYLVKYIYSKEKNKIKVFCIFTFCSILVYSELSSVAYTLPEYNKHEKYSEPLYNTLSSLINNKAKHIFISSGSFYQKPAIYATRNKMTLNDGYFARSIPTETQIEKLEKDTVYIIKKESYFNYKHLVSDNTYTIFVDDYIIIFNKRLALKKPSQNILLNLDKIFPNDFKIKDAVSFKES